MLRKLPIIILDKVGLSAEDRFEYSKVKFHSYPDKFYYTNSYFVQLTMTFSLATLLLSTGGGASGGGWQYFMFYGFYGRMPLFWAQNSDVCP